MLIYEKMQILNISTFDKTGVNELLTEIQVNQNYIEQFVLFNNQILAKPKYLQIINYSFNFRLRFFYGKLLITTIKIPSIQSSSLMETKKFTQFGTFSVIIMLPLLLLFTGMMIKSGLTNSPDFYIHIFLVLTFLICSLIFYKLTIFVDNKRVSFKLGIGLVGKSYKIADIKSCKPVSNSAFNGIGIHMLSNGWLYNVTGLKAIELHFNNKKSVVRIGTNKPEEISQVIQKLIGGDIPNENVYKTTKKWINPLWLLSIMSIPALLIIPQYQETKVEFDNSRFIIKGVYGLIIPNTDLMQIDTVSAIQRISLRTNGYAFGKTLS